MSDEDYETWVRGGVSPTLNAFDNATETRATVLVSFDTQFGSNANVFEDVSPTLKATQAPPSIFPAIGFYPTGGTHGVSAMDEVSPPVKVGSGLGISSPPAVLAPTLTSSNDPSRSPQSSEITQQVSAVLEASMQVRRLTPVEVCRLQGFPDDWNTGLPDSARYKQMGNAVTVNVANYIATLINSAVRASA